MRLVQEVAEGVACLFDDDGLRAPAYGGVEVREALRRCRRGEEGLADGGVFSSPWPLAALSTVPPTRTSGRSALYLEGVHQGEKQLGTVGTELRSRTWLRLHPSEGRQAA